jgi:hypothetical protein
MGLLSFMEEDNIEGFANDFIHWLYIAIENKDSHQSNVFIESVCFLFIEILLFAFLHCLFSISHYSIPKI